MLFEVAQLSFKNCFCFGYLLGFRKVFVNQVYFVCFLLGGYLLGFSFGCWGNLMCMSLGFSEECPCSERSFTYAPFRKDFIEN